MMKEPNSGPPRYRWPWFVAAAVALGFILAVIWMRAAVNTLRQERDLNSPLPASAPAR
jgi:hypothetical protein